MPWRPVSFGPLPKGVHIELKVRDVGKAVQDEAKAWEKDGIGNEKVSALLSITLGSRIT